MNVKIFLSSLEDCKATSMDCGTITRISKDAIFVACNNREIKIIEIQIPGKKRIKVRDYLNGIRKEDLIGKKFI